MIRSLYESHRGAVLVVVGFALLLNPHVVGALDLGDTDTFRYESAEVTFTEDWRIESSDEGVFVGVLDSDVVCLRVEVTRTCMLERAIHANGGLTYDGRNFTDSHPRRYVFVTNEGFFRRTSTATADGAVNYSLRHVPREEALDDVAARFGRVSDGAREAITTGQYTASDRLSWANELIRYRGSYYVVYLASEEPQDPRLSLGKGKLAFFQWILGIGGAGLVLRGQRLRVVAGANE